MLAALEGLPASSLECPGAGSAAAAEGSSDSRNVPLLPSSASVLKDLCWAVLRPVCGSMAGVVKKRVPTVAAFVNVAMMPALFSAPALGCVMEGTGACEEGRLLLVRLRINIHGAICFG